MPADSGSHVFLGRVGPEPRELSDSALSGARAWYHVHCLMDGPQAPVAVALTRAGVVAGDRVNPGATLDIQGTSIWLVGPKDGQSALVSVERRFAPTHRSDTLLGELVTLTSWKSSGMGLEITPGKWHNPWTNILGMGLGLLKATGGRVWFGTHVDTSLPPPPTAEALARSAGLFPLDPSDGPLLLPGNPALYCCAFEPRVFLYLAKLAGGRQFGPGGEPWQS